MRWCTVYMLPISAFTPNMYTHTLHTHLDRFCGCVSILFRKLWVFSSIFRMSSSKHSSSVHDLCACEHECDGVCSRESNRISDMCSGRKWRQINHNCMGTCIHTHYTYLYFSLDKHSFPRHMALCAVYRLPPTWPPLHTANAAAYLAMQQQQQQQM